MEEQKTECARVWIKTLGERPDEKCLMAALNVQTERGTSMGWKKLNGRSKWKLAWIIQGWIDTWMGLNDYAAWDSIRRCCREETQECYHSQQMVASDFIGCRRWWDACLTDDVAERSACLTEDDSYYSMIQCTACSHLYYFLLLSHLYGCVRPFCHLDSPEVFLLAPVSSFMYPSLFLHVSFSSPSCLIFSTCLFLRFLQNTRPPGLNCCHSALRLSALIRPSTFGPMIFVSPSLCLAPASVATSHSLVSFPFALLFRSLTGQCSYAYP